MKRKVTRRAQILIFIWHLHLFFLFSLFYLYTSHIQTCAHTCTHKPVYIPTCAYLIISRVSENTCSESLEVHRERKAAFSVVLPEMLCRISPYRVIIKECVWKFWKCPYSSPSAPDTRHGHRTSLRRPNIFSVLQFWKLAVHINVLQSLYIWEVEYYLISCRLILVATRYILKWMSYSS